MTVSEPIMGKLIQAVSSISSILISTTTEQLNNKPTNSRETIKASTNISLKTTVKVEVATKKAANLTIPTTRAVVDTTITTTTIPTTTTRDATIIIATTIAGNMITRDMTTEAEVIGIMMIRDMMIEVVATADMMIVNMIIEAQLMEIFIAIIIKEEDIRMIEEGIISSSSIIIAMIVDMMIGASLQESIEVAIIAIRTIETITMIEEVAEETIEMIKGIIIRGIMILIGHMEVEVIQIMAATTTIILSKVKDR